MMNRYPGFDASTEELQELKGMAERLRQALLLFPTQSTAYLPARQPQLEELLEEEVEGPNGQGIATPTGTPQVTAGMPRRRQLPWRYSWPDDSAMKSSPACSPSTPSATPRAAQASETEVSQTSQMRLGS